VQSALSVAGLPDIAGILDDGRPLFVEVKTETGKLSEDQAKFLFEAHKRKALCCVARSLNQFEEWFLNNTK
jgi:hypothetical protein